MLVVALVIAVAVLAVDVKILNDVMQSVMKISIGA